MVKKWSGQTIDKMNSSEECMVQKIEKNVGLSEKDETTTRKKRIYDAF